MLAKARNTTRSRLVGLLCLATAGCQSTDNDKPAQPPARPQLQSTGASFSLYSKSVADSFHIRVGLPAGYDPARRYPVLYVLDANLYFDVVAAYCRDYARANLVQDRIVVGVGYKDLTASDSLRNRDYTYPAALPAYEMPLSGGGLRFAAFLEDELAPAIQARYQTDTAHRALVGHSLGGYLGVLVYYRQLLSGQHTYADIIAASPSLDYNGGYLLRVMASLSPNRLPLSQGSARLHITYGTREDAENAEDGDITSTSRQTLAGLRHSFARLRNPALQLRADTLGGMRHMQTLLPTLILALP